MSDTVKKTQKRFWYFFHEKAKSEAIPDILTDGISEYCGDTASKGDSFNKHFQTVFNKDISLTNLNVEITRTKNINLSSSVFDHLQILKISSGFDCMPIKHLSQIISHHVFLRNVHMSNFHPLR